MTIFVTVVPERAFLCAVLIGFPYLAHHIIPKDRAIQGTA